MRTRSLLAASSLLFGTLVPPMPAALARPVTQDTERVLANGFALGRDVGGEPCTMAFRWGDPDASGPTDRSYSIACRGATSSRVVGTVTVTRAGVAEPGCGEGVEVKLRGGIVARARACGGRRLGRETVSIAFEANGYVYRGESVLPVAGPLEVALVSLANRVVPDVSATERLQASFDVTKIGEARPGEAAAAGPALFNPYLALRQGTQLNRQGRYVEASRVMSDALPRVPGDAPAALRTELALESALADSNVGAFGIARNRFALASGMLKEVPSGERLAILNQKLRVYEAFDAINRGDTAGALRLLGTAAEGAEGAYPLENPITLVALNRPSTAAAADTSRALTAQEEQRRELALLALQERRIRSRVYLATRSPDRIARAEAALRPASAGTDTSCTKAVSDGIAGTMAGTSRGSYAWMEAAMLRQCARIAAERKDLAGAASAAKAAVDALEAGAIESGGYGQAIAEARIEGGRYYREAGQTALAKAEFEAAIATLGQGSEPLIAPPPGIESYLDLLVAEHEANRAGTASADYFRTVQLLGTPAIARQTAEIQRIMVADGELGIKFRDRLDLDRDLRRLNYQIGQIRTGAAGADPAKLAEYERLAKEKADARDKLSLELGGQDIDNSPLALKALQDRLRTRPGEVYYKLTTIPRGPSYAMLVDADTARIFKIKAPSRDLDKLADELRKSAAGTDTERAGFKVVLAATLFDLLGGPVTADLAKAQSIVVDGAGPLGIVPMGILITDPQTVVAYNRTARTRGGDYSQIAFLAKTAKISTALSPRSFEITRKMPAALVRQGEALKPFLGLGAPDMPQPAQAAAAARAFGTGRCPTAGEIYARRIWAMAPIGGEGIAVAQDALGVPRSAAIVGAAFTDQALLARTDLDQYQVLHFATHGLPEQQVECADVPPALTTSLGEPGISDGLLSYDEIAQLSLNANLVVLAACETYSGLSAEAAASSGQDAGGATLAGLTRAFLNAQARAVMATYWKVPVGASTDKLMAQLYTSGKQEDIGGALREAQRSLIGNATTSHPYYWGAYFVVGNSANRMLASDDAASAKPGAVAAAAAAASGGVRLGAR